MNNIDLKILNDDEIEKALSKNKEGYEFKYLSMYSSYLNGIVKDPKWMMIPIDDHMVHRGDGVFEAFRSHKCKILELKAHLDRLEFSAQSIGLKIPKTNNEIESICNELIRIDDNSDEDILFRLFVSRGPGGFSPDPYESMLSCLYIVATRFKKPDLSWYLNGVSAIKSSIEVKLRPYSQIKNCNYLQNVLMKKESKDLGVDFGLGFTKEGWLAEGPTENVMILDKNRQLLVPSFDFTLKGTTLLRVIELVKENLLANNKFVSGISMDSKISLKQVEEAQEIFLIGTTLGIVPVTLWQGEKVGVGKPGEVFKWLNQLLIEYYGLVR